MTYDALKDLLRFLGDSPTAWHATLEIGNRLAQQDYTPFDEQEKWGSQPWERLLCRKGRLDLCICFAKTSTKENNYPCLSYR